MLLRAGRVGHAKRGVPAARHAQQSPALTSLDLSLTEATHEFQVQYIEKQIERSRGNMTEAAERLGLHRSNLYRKMRQLGMATN